MVCSCCFAARPSQVTLRLKLKLGDLVDSMMSSRRGSQRLCSQVATRPAALAPVIAVRMRLMSYPRSAR